MPHKFCNAAIASLSHKQAADKQDIIESNKWESHVDDPHLGQWINWRWIGA